MFIVAIPGEMQSSDWWDSRVGPRQTGRRSTNHSRSIDCHWRSWSVYIRVCLSLSVCLSVCLYVCRHQS